MNTKHTPGPWRISGNGREVYANHPDRFSVPFVVADCTGREPFGPIDMAHHIGTAKANATLIASAPDMAKELAQLRADKAELVGGIQKLLNNFVTAEAYPEFIANRNNDRFVDMASAETVARAIIAKYTKV